MKEKKINKTNALRILDSLNINYEIHEYSDEITDGVEVSKLINKDPNCVFKTLVTVNNNNLYYVFMVPVNETLDLKKAAMLTNSKSIEMIKQKDLLPLTGYVHGGCSPIGMKKNFPTFIDESAMLFDTICFSGGKKGLNIELDPSILIDTFHISTGDVCKAH